MSATDADQRTGHRHWQALLDDRWRARLEEVTGLSLAYHRVAANTPGGLGSVPGQKEARRLLPRAVAASRNLADVEDALGRLATGSFGNCEQCEATIEPRLLAVAPEARYCARCACGSGAAAVPVPGENHR